MRTLHFHIGPHKTGSTAIQGMMRRHTNFFEETHSLYFVDDPVVGYISKTLNNQQESVTIDSLSKLADICRSHPGDCLISCEDISGKLPGRSKKRKPYPRLYENINAIRKALPSFHCKFYFFTRNTDEWVRSAYAQIIKHSTKFADFNEYTSFLRTDELWDKVLRKPREKMASDFTEIPYKEGTGFSSVDALLHAILGVDQTLDVPQEARRPNSSPSTVVLQLFEAINRSGASPDAQRLAKEWLQTGQVFPVMSANALRFPNWPAHSQKPSWLSVQLGALWERNSERVDRQEQPNFLPDPFCNLSDFRTKLVESSEKFPEGSRAEMSNQVGILKYRFRGLPQTCYLLGLVTSYLRRDTDHTEHAAFLFQRLWEEEYAILLGSLPTRWLISTFQTFLDHGVNDTQRLIGSSAYFLSNILKAYETERALDGLPPDRVYPNVTPVTKGGFAGMDRFKLGGTDLLLNTNSLLLELASQDDRAGRVVQEFMLRTKVANSIFSRMDHSRIEHNIDIKQFSNCWSFFEDPRGSSSNE